MDAPLSTAIVAEKPSVGRDIARVVGARQSGQGFLHGGGYVVTWAIGHLVMLAQPHEIRPEWRSWRRERLPMLPAEWPLVVGEQTKDQFEVVRRILTSPKIGRVICATDAGREGELIFRYIYEAAHSDKPVERLWISSLTAEAIHDGLARLRPAHDYEPLANAARGRSRADWLVGMNLSRAYTLACNEDLSVGRVQTPTLAMLVERELAIRAFVPEDYLNVVATFSPAEGQTYRGTWFRPGVDPLDAAAKLPKDGEEARSIVARAKRGRARILSLTSQTKRMPAPGLYDLTELQRHANRLYGFSAQRTLDAAQALYERHKLLSYPRTDSRHLSADVARTLPKVVSAVAPAYPGLLAPGSGERPLGRRYVDDSKVTDHHAIIPTGVSPARANLGDEEQKIFDLVCRRLLQAWHDDYITSVTTVITVIENAEPTAEDRYHSSGTVVDQLGWKGLDVGGGKKKPRKKARAEDDASDEPGEDDQPLPPGLAKDQPQQVLEAEALRKRTRAPKRFSEAALLTAMETAGKTLDDKELSDAMKESGLGTPATRAQIIEVLLKRGYIERSAKSLVATDKGVRLIEVVHPEVKSPAMTGQWEAFLKRIEQGQAQLSPFLSGIEDYVRDVVGKVFSAGFSPRAATSAAHSPVAVRPPAAAEPAALRAEPAAPADLGNAPPEVVWADDSQPAAAPTVPSATAAALAAAPRSSLEQVLKDRFGYDGFRVNQQPVCQALMDDQDVLLVMPTGSGKSLCYQLPGIAKGGTTLVISPLIALMEDQVAKLRGFGFAAERIHSNLDRARSREVCRAYLDGRLDFLFIAPERLRVPGFPEMLAKRKPCLVAIDEAHCISQWGHDFRPDYRNIGQHLPALRPAPVIALTATATPLVQEDIASQLGLVQPRPFIHGFRRDNIAIEVVKAPPSARDQMVRDILDDDDRRPAIVYTPRRRDAERIAATLSASYRAEAYHAGLDAATRHAVQARFLDGKLDVTVATIAFGMGIDKPDIRTVIHTALPGSLEGYYQEMGRAGRDGLPSRAILMHSYADRYAHDFFYERDYPAPTVLEGVYSLLGDDPLPKAILSGRSGLDGEAFDIALEKLWIHGGAVIDYEENVARGAPHWSAPYQAQREHKMAQFERMLAYCSSSSCRMQTLVRYFGDLEDAGRRCGVCDICSTSETLAQSYRDSSEAERQQAAAILEALRTHGSTATGRLHMQLFADGSLDRRAFEDVLGAMARAGLLEIVEETFEREGRRIDFRKARLTPAGRDAGETPELRIPVEAAAIRRSKKKTPKKAAAKKRATSTEPRRTPPAAAAKRASAEPAQPAKPAARKTRLPAAQPAQPLLIPQAAPDAAALTEALRAWRLTEARRLGVPAFRVMTDKTLSAIVAARPSTTRELLAVPGMGLAAVEKYGARLFRILNTPK